MQRSLCKQFEKALSVLPLILVYALRLETPAPAPRAVADPVAAWPRAFKQHIC